MKSKHFYIAAILCLVALGCGAQAGATDTLPPPFATRAVSNNSKVIGWPAGKTPQAPAGFVVNKYADGLKNPRWIYQLPNNDVLISLVD